MYWAALLLDKPSGAASTHDDDLHGLAVWALQWTPRVAIVDEAVCMEVEASLRLFGGKRALQERVRSEGAELGVAIASWASTALAALAFARAGVENGFARPLRSALVAVITLPIALLTAFIVMQLQGLSANILSLGGIALAIGAALDAQVILVENVHKKLEAFEHANGRLPLAAERWALVAEASIEVGPALFFSLPLEMFETTVQFKPRDHWRPGMTLDKLVDELDRIVKVPGLSNVWVPPIRNRIDMLATGIKSPIGVKVAGADLATIDRLTTQIEAAVKNVPGVSSALAERLTGGRYIDVDVDRPAAARYGLQVADVQAVVSTSIGGDEVGEVVQGRERYSINVRYPREIRDSLERLRQLPFITNKGATVLLQDVAQLSIAEGPPMIRSENARLSGWVYVDVRGRDLRSVVTDMQAAVATQVAMPAGYAVSWSGQFKYFERATERLKVVVPVTLAVIFVLLYLLFRSFSDAGLVMAAVPFALVGGFWLVWALGHAVSVATAVGFIALAGLAAEFGVVMLIYLKSAHARRLAAGEPDDEETLLAAIREGAVLRVRPKAMTVSVVLAGLLPLMWASGTGSEVMTRIAAPMVGGMVTAPLLSMLVMPATWYLVHRRRRSSVAAPVSVVPSASATSSN